MYNHAMLLFIIGQSRLACSDRAAAVALGVILIFVVLIATALVTLLSLLIFSRYNVSMHGTMYSVNQQVTLVSISSAICAHDKS